VLEAGSAIVVAGAGTGSIEPPAGESTMLGLPGEVVAARNVGPCVVGVRRGRPAALTADGDGPAVGGGAVGGG